MHVVLLLHQLFSDKKNHLSPRFPKGRFESIHILPSDHWKYGNLLKKLALLKFQGFIFFCMSALWTSFSFKYIKAVTK